MNSIILKLKRREMIKSMIFTLKFLLLTLLSGNLNAQCVSVGSDVGKSTLTQAVTDGTLSITNGELNEKHICINGQFTFDLFIVDISDVVFDNFGVLIFENSVVTGNNVIIDNGWVLIDGSSLDLDGLDCLNNNKFELSNSSYGRFDNSLFNASNIGRRIRLLDYSRFLCTTTIFDETGIDVEGNSILIPVDSDFLGDLHPAIHIKKGAVVGKENYFKDNSMGVFLDGESGNYTNYTDDNSVYEDLPFAADPEFGINGAGIVSFAGTNLYVINSIFNNCEEVGIASLQTASGSKLYKNKLNDNARGIWIKRDNNAIVSKNEFKNTAVASIINELGSDNVVEQNTISSFNTNVGQNFGIFSFVSVNARYELNNISGNGNAGIRSEFDVNASFHTNVIDSGYVSGVYSINSELSEYCNNSLFSNQSGGKFGLDNLQLNLKDNHFWLNNKGLIYEEDIIAPQQVEKGNDFYNNSSIGAEFEGNPSLFALEMMQYITDGSSVDYPSHSPSNFFTATGAQSLHCPAIIPPTGGGGPYPEEKDKDLLKFMIDCIKVNGAECDYRKIKAFNQIENYPSFLTNPDLTSFYNQYINTGTDQVPLMNEIVEAFSSISFVPTPIPVSIDNQNNISIGPDLENILIANDIGYQDYYNDKVNLVNTLKSHIGGITPDNNYQQLYLEVLTIYLDLTLTSPVQSQKDDLKAAAELCYDTDGVGVLLARNLCLSYQIDFTVPQNCNDPRTRESESDENTNLYVYPNPSNGIFNLNSGNVIHSFEVYNSNGVLIKSDKINGNTIDLSESPNGMYILKLKSQNKTIKLIKIN